MSGKETATLWLDRLGRWALAGVFLYAAIPKILDPAGFALDISHFGIVPDALLPIIAVTLPWIEALAALALLTGFAADGGILLILLLLFAFMGGLLQAWIRGLDIDCGCFGHKEGAAGNILVAILRDLLFIGIAFPVFLHRLRKNSRGVPQGGPPAEPNPTRT